MPALRGCDYDCGKLLDEMRPEVEALLEESKAMFGDRIPTCDSQSHRALRALDCIKEKRDEIRGEKLAVWWPKYMRITRISNRLEKFLAVHDAVNILERRTRDSSLDVFGYDKELVQVADHPAKDHGKD